MRTRVLASAALLGLVLWGGCPDAGLPTQQAHEEFSTALSFAGIQSLRIEWPAGNITVRVDAGADELSAYGTKHASASSSAAATAALSDIAITLVADTADPSVGVLELSHPTPITILYSADVEVVLPAGVALDVNGDAGNVTVTGNAGYTRVQAATGDVEITEHVGNTEVFAGTGRVEIDSSNGDVYVQGVNANINVYARPAPGGTVTALAEANAVRIRVPADFAATLNLTTPPLVGNVEVDLTGFVVTDLSTQPYAVLATLNGGGGQIRGDCQTGAVRFEALHE